MSFKRQGNNPAPSGAGPMTGNEAMPGPSKPTTLEEPQPSTSRQRQWREAPAEKKQGKTVRRKFKYPHTQYTKPKPINPFSPRGIYLQRNLISPARYHVENRQVYVGEKKHVVPKFKTVQGMRKGWVVRRLGYCTAVVTRDRNVRVPNRLPEYNGYTPSKLSFKDLEKKSN